MERKASKLECELSQRITDFTASLHNALDLPTEELPLVETILEHLVSAVVKDIRTSIKNIHPVYQGRDARIRERGGEDLRIILLQSI